MKRLLKFRYAPDEGVLVKYEKSIKASMSYETITLESEEKPHKILWLCQKHHNELHYFLRNQNALVLLMRKATRDHSKLLEIARARRGQ